MRAGLPDFVRARLDPEQRFGLRVSLLAAAFILVAVPFSTLLFQVLGDGPITRLDARIATRLNDAVHDNPGWLSFLKGISWLGRPLPLAVLIALGAGYALRHGRRRVALYLVVTSASGGIVDSVVKILVDRPRPEVDHPVHTAFGKSFPSGHSMSSTICFGALLLVYLAAVNPRWRPAVIAATATLVLAIGTSRLLLGVHFLSDVLGGFALGLAWLFGATALFEVWRQETGKRPSEPLEEGIEPEAGAALC